MRVWAIGLIGGILALIGAGYYLVGDGTLPSDPEFDFQISVLRSLAQADSESLPHTIETVSVGSRDVPSFAVEAGAFGEDVTMTRALFRIRSDWGDTLVDVGMDESVWTEFSPEDEFNADGFANALNAIGHARRIVMTHEHPDHMGFLARYDDLDQITGTLRMTQEQIEGTAKYAANGLVPESLTRLEPLSSEHPSAVAPGIVVLPAPGHTPGSIVLFVQLRGGQEVLLVGDLIWNMSNLHNERGRPRLVQQFLMPEPEDRSAVYDQVSALVQLSERNPDLLILPSHDADLIARLIEDGRLVSGFATQPNPPSVGE